MGNLILDIKLTQENMFSSWTFADQVNKQQSGRDFGNTSMLREIKDSIADTIAGKLGEFAFREFLVQNFSIMSEIDLAIYDGVNSTDDGNDIPKFYIGAHQMQNYYAIDVKTSKRNSQWLLCEKHKLDRFDPEAVVFCSLAGVPADIEKKPEWFLEQEYISASIKGFVFNRNDLLDESGTPRFFFQRGDRLPKTQVFKKCLTEKPTAADVRQTINSLSNEDFLIMPGGLKTSNVGWPICSLRNDLDEWRYLISNMIWPEKINHGP